MLRMRALILLLSCGCCLGLAAQQDSSTATLLLALKSPNIQQRINAYEKLKRDEEALKHADVQAALLDLLNRENRLIHGVTLVDRGEGYAEYVADLLGTVAVTADWRDQRQACILAEGPYNPDSKFADELAVSETDTTLSHQEGIPDVTLPVRHQFGMSRAWLWSDVTRFGLDEGRGSACP